MGEGSILSRHSSRISQPSLTLSEGLEMSVGIKKQNKEVCMETRKTKYSNMTALKMSIQIKLKIRIIVAIAASCLMATPST